MEGGAEVLMDAALLMDLPSPFVDVWKGRDWREARR